MFISLQVFSIAGRMKRAERALIIAGTGRNSGKSSLAELLISRFADRGVTGVKITPHSHPEMSGLERLVEKNRFQIFEEKNRNSGKDSPRMLRAGAAKVFLVVSPEENLAEAFESLQSFIPPGSPVIYESPALRRFVEPDLFVVMQNDSDFSTDRKKIDDLLSVADIVLSLDEMKVFSYQYISLSVSNNWKSDWPPNQNHINQ